MLKLITRTPPNGRRAYREVSYAEHVARMAELHEVALPAETGDGAVLARFDHGRWLADCPYCTGAEAVDPEDRRFFCFNCLNNDAGEWLSVVLPDDYAAIEASLAELPSTEQHWRPA